MQNTLEVNNVSTNNRFNEVQQNNKMITFYE